MMVWASVIYCMQHAGAAFSAGKQHAVCLHHVACLQDWLRHWPRQQLLILRYEDYIAAVPQHLKAVLAFLDLSQPEAATFEAMAAAEPQNKKAYPPMRADTRQELESFYAPFNAALSKLLDDARWTWADDQARGQGLSASPPAAATPG